MKKQNHYPFIYPCLTCKISQFNQNLTILQNYNKKKKKIFLADL